MNRLQGVFDTQHRCVKLGIVLGMSLVASEGLAVTTIAPRFAERLDSMELYGWVFAASCSCRSWASSSQVNPSTVTAPDPPSRRQMGRGRQGRVFVGTLTLALGIAVQLVALAFPSLALALTTLGWVVAGLGIGFAHATASVLAFARAPEQQEGRVSSALQLADQFAPALSTGAAGALFAAVTRGGGGEAEGLMLAVALSLALALLSAASARRIGAAS